MKVSIYNVLVLLLFLNCTLLAQESPRYFKPVIFAGLCASEVDGDLYGGLNKAGVFAGFGISRKFHEKWIFDLGLSYIQKGSRKNINPKENDYTYYILRLNYIEAPLLFKYEIKKFKILAGINAAYLIRSYEESHVGIITYPFKKYDVCLTAGMEFNIVGGLSTVIRYNYSVTPVRDYLVNTVYNPGIFVRWAKPGLYNNYVVLSLNYAFNLKKKNESQQ